MEPLGPTPLPDALERGLSHNYYHLYKTYVEINWRRMKVQHVAVPCHITFRGPGSHSAKEEKNYKWEVTNHHVEKM